ncbi:MAG: winged helix-turn-helix transcriptional regulator [Candidatus Thorarchaeota archaeon]
MDSIDKGILSDLLANCRQTYQELSRKYGISANAIRMRVMKLEESGVIRGYAINLRPAMLGTNFILALLVTDGSQDEEEFIHTIGKHPGVLAASSYTDGIYPLVAEYTNAEELMELGAYLRGLESVVSAEIHPLVVKHGMEMKMSGLHIRVLRHLIDDPRMSIADLSERTGLTSRRVRRLVTELIESDAVDFRALLELGSAESIPFLARVLWNESTSEYSELLSWLQENFEFHLWESYISASEPVMFCLLTADDLSRVDSIAREIRRNDSVASVKVMISTHHKYFPGLRGIRLSEMVGQKQEK